jgi:hypothetical protein
MIPEFPQFKKLELSDKNDVEKFTSKFPPYSDFNFVSMWSWDIKDGMLLSVLNNNLVVRFSDYLTGEFFYSFLGNNQVNETVKKLLELSKKEGLEMKLKLVPEDSLKGLDLNKFKTEEDRDNFDYIYDVSLISEYTGAKFSDKRSNVSSYLRKFLNIRTEILDLKNPSIQKGVIKLDEKWLKQKKEKNIDYDFNSSEIVAIEKFFQSEMLNIISIGIFDYKRLIGYSFFEILPNKYCICHFAKADNLFKDTYDYLIKEGTEILKSRGCIFLNYEQDLGLRGLRKSKMSFRPVNFLKKLNCDYKQ